MKTNKETLQTMMDRRLSFLDDLPSCRAAVQVRIAQEEKPVMKKKISLGFVFAIVLALLSVAALAAGFLLSPRATAVQTADQAMEKTRGINSEMMTFFGREEKELPDGSVQVTYSGVGSMDYVLGTYTVTVKDGRTEITWSHDGEDTSGGYEAEAWGLDQLKQMLTDCLDQKSKETFLAKALAIAERHNPPEDDTPSEPLENYFEQIEAAKTNAMAARKLSEAEMIAIGREFIISSYGLNEEQAARMELYTNFDRQDPDQAGPGSTGTEGSENGWYDMINGKPCFEVEYLLYQPEVPEQEGIEAGPLPREEKDGYYIVYVNVETGVIEEYEYNSGLAGQG